MNIQVTYLSLLLVTLAGCSSLRPTDEEIAATDMPDNTLLHEVDYDDDRVGVQWVSNTIKPHDYTALMVPKVELKQDLTQDKQIPKSVLDNLANVITDQLRKNISIPMTVVDKAGPHVARINIRISRATTEARDLALTEMTPVGAVIGSIKMAAGTRDKTARIIIEVHIVDSVTSERLAGRVSAIIAPAALENDESHLNYEQIRKDVDNFVNDTRMFIESAAHEVKQNNAE
ncbi:DUF3313 family protein [Shewanella sp. VB17]|uniref:DUF3313 family protein n=1 Tax=Shewanella sp. VB17 TaxID=2739432 RepID=UPI001563C4C7|nr:DUF3313 family protein [Shewanella sp. VB17]NRD73412.1 DUF3313 family protein [Shewanella sp. VB17]